MIEKQVYEDELKERVSNWIEKKKEKGLTQSKLAELWGVDSSYISALKKKKEGVGVKVIANILKVDKSINLHWLILGTGEIYSEQNYSISEESFRGDVNENRKEKIDKDIYLTIVNAYEQDRILWTNQIQVLTEIIKTKL